MGPDNTDEVDSMLAGVQTSLERRRRKKLWLLVFLLVVTALLGVLILVWAYLSIGFCHDLLLNLGTELLGAVITTILLGLLWAWVEAAITRDKEQIDRLIHFRLQTTAPSWPPRPESSDDPKLGPG